jgi:hypothetical protein
MDPIRLHLVLNHLPVIGAALALGVLLVGIFRSNLTIIRTGLALAIVSLAVVPVVNWSGEQAEKIVEQADWLDAEGADWLDEHEERGEAAVATLLSALVVCILALLVGAFRQNWLRAAAMVAAVSLAIGLGNGLWAASSGGKIRHTEIRGAGGGE